MFYFYCRFFAIWWTLRIWNFCLYFWSFFIVWIICDCTLLFIFDALNLKTSISIWSTEICYSITEIQILTDFVFFFESNFLIFNNFFIILFVLLYIIEIIWVFFCIINDLFILWNLKFIFIWGTTWTSLYSLFFLFEFLFCTPFL